MTEKWWVFDLSYCVQKFSNCNLLGWTFLQFFHRFELSNEFCALWNSYRVFGKYLYQHFFLNWKPNADETAQKNDKHILSMCLWIPFYIHFRPRMLHFVKKSKSLYLNVQYTYKACFYLLISCQMPEKRLQVEKRVKQFFLQILLSLTHTWRTILYLHSNEEKKCQGWLLKTKWTAASFSFVLANLTTTTIYYCQNYVYDVALFGGYFGHLVPVVIHTHTVQ